VHTILYDSPKENRNPSALELNIRHDLPFVRWRHSLPTLFQTCPHTSEEVPYHTCLAVVSLPVTTTYNPLHGYFHIIITIYHLLLPAPAHGTYCIVHISHADLSEAAADTTSTTRYQLGRLDLSACALCSLTASTKRGRPSNVFLSCLPSFGTCALYILSLSSSC
jgi:hypothetical protein